MLITSYLAEFAASRTLQPYKPIQHVTFAKQKFFEKKVETLPSSGNDGASDLVWE